MNLWGKTKNFQAEDVGRAPCSVLLLKLVHLGLSAPLKEMTARDNKYKEREFWKSAPVFVTYFGKFKS